MPNSDPLLLRIGYAGEPLEEKARGIHHLQPHPEVLAEHALDGAPLSLSKRSVVDEDARETVSDGAVNQDSRHGRVHASRETTDHLVITHPLPHPPHLRLHDATGRPRTGAAGDPEDEVLQDLLAPRRVHDLRVKLHAVHLSIDRPEGGHRSAVGARQHLVARRRLAQVIPVAHPHRDLLARLEAVEEPVRGNDLENGTTILPATGPHDMTARQLPNELHAIADAQERHAYFQKLRTGARDLIIVDARRTSREDDPRRIPLPDPVRRSVRRMDLTVDSLLADAPRDELRVLGTVIEDENAVGHLIRLRSTRRGARPLPLPSPCREPTPFGPAPHRGL